jgi:glycosyl transferase family 25
MLPIFIISLPEAQERRTRITGIMNDLGLEFQFIDAVDGRQFDVINHPNYDAAKRLRCFGKHLTGGDIGCTLSHKKIYQKMVDENIAKALIFEDDIIIKEGFVDSLTELLTTPVPFDMVRFLGSPKLERLKLRPVYKLNSGHTLTRHTGMPGGSHATLMTLNAAQKALRHMNRIAYPIDAILGRSWVTGINWYTVRPGLVAQDREIESMIGDDTRFDNKRDVQGLQKILYPLTRAWFKLVETLGKKYWYLKTYFKDKKHGRR